MKQHNIDLSTEDGHQYALMLWSRQASVRAQYPELALLYHIELKTPTGRATPDQRWWCERLNAEGCFAEICHGWESAAWVLEWYLGLGKEE